MSVDMKKVKRLQHTILKLAQWQGYDLADLVADGLLEEGDLK